MGSDAGTPQILMVSKHGYYLTYRNHRAEYLKACWAVVDWGYVGIRLEGARAGTTQI